MQVTKESKMVEWYQVGDFKFQTEEEAEEFVEEYEEKEEMFEKLCNQISELGCTNYHTCTDCPFYSIENYEEQFGLN